MSPQAWVLVCALDLLGRSAGSFPPIRILSTPPTYASQNAQGFIDRREGIIYLIASAPAFAQAQQAESTVRGRGRCEERTALKMVASVIIHEEWHLKHGADERGAYQAQLMQLYFFGLAPESATIQSVKRSMRAALEAYSIQGSGSEIAPLANTREPRSRGQ